MSVEVVMPQMGESIAEGTITKWHKKPGDALTRDEPLFEITTDKVDTEVPAPVNGVLQQILVAVDETVAVGTVVAVISEGATETAGSRTDTTAPMPAVDVSEPTAPASSPKPAGGHFQDSHEARTFERRAETPAEPPPSGAPEPDQTTDRSHQLSPAVAALAARHHLPMEELTAIEGTGRGGRISKKDLEAHLESRSERRPEAAPTPTDAPPPSPSETTGSWSTVDPPAIATTTSETPPDAFLYRPEPDDRLVPMSSQQQQIAEHMLWSQRLSAQVTSFVECDMHRIVRFRDERGAGFEADEGIPLNFLPFVADASVRALREFPILNASVVGDHIAYKRHVHLGVAVSIEQGLIAPVIRNADEMNFTGLARSLHAAETKARRQGLRPDDVQGATFTITNPGLFGGLMGTPMIPQPQVATLALGGVQKKPVVIDDAIAIRPVMVIALTFDHRIIDGATGAQFLERVRSHLEQAELPDA